MSRVRDKADFQFAGEDYTHGGGVKYVANMIQTTDLDASGTISNIHLQDIADVASVSSSNDGHFLKYDHSTTAFVWAQVSGGGGGGSLNNVVEDTTPQLGGNLDINGNDIVSVSNANIDILPDGLGKINLDGNGSTSGITVSDGLIEMRSGTGSVATIDMYCEVNNAHKVTLKPPAHANFSGNVLFQLPNSNGTSGQYLKTDGNGVTSWATVSGGGSTGDISFNASTISSSGSTITLDDNVTVTGTLTSSQAGSPILTSASSLTLQASDRVHINQSPLRLYNVSTTNRNLLTAADGDMVYDSTLNETYAYHNGSWTSLSGGGGGGSATDILTITTTSSVPPTAPSSGSVNIYEDNSTLTFQNSRAGTGHYQLKMENSAGTFLMGVDGLGNIITGTSGTMRAQYFYAVSNTSYYVAPALTGTAMQLAGDMKTDGSYIGSIKERSNADTTTSGTLNFDAKDYEIYRLTQNQTANRTLNIRGDGSSDLDSIMSNNEFRTVAVAFKNGSTPYYFNTFQIDGSAITVLWSGGSAPSAGNASSTDFYTLSICKTGSATFTVIANLTKTS